MGGGKHRDHRSELVLGYGLEVVEVDGAGPGHAILGRQEDFGGDVPDGGGDRRDGDFPEVLQDGVSGEEEDGTLLVRAAEPVPADLASSHSSPQTCSASQLSNSPGVTGWRS